jgi:hypothetical protein
VTNTDPVSWFVIEEGWKVVDSGGEEVGAVDEVVGDSSNDIFNGLAISTSLLGRPRYVPAEKVGTITEGRVEIRLTKTEVEQLGEFEEPPTSAEILPERAGLLRRAEGAVEAPIHSRPERENVWRRLWWAVRRIVGR